MLYHNKTIEQVRSMLTLGQQLGFEYDPSIEPESTDDSTWVIKDSKGPIVHLYVNNGFITDQYDHL